MKDKIKLAFSGLTKQYYFRQLFFGLAMGLIFLLGGWGKQSLSSIILILVSIPLYPYSRFVYESIVEFIMGQNIIFTNAILFFVLKIMSMFICFFLAVFIAPIGLLYLYFHMKGLENTTNEEAIEKAE